MALYNSINNASFPTGDHNTIMGPFAGGHGNFAPATCTDNTIYGYLGGRSFVTSCSQNSIFGAAAGISITAGGGNTLLGFEAGKAMTTANGTIAIGVSPLLNVLDGILLIGIGYNAGVNYTGSESSNICIANSGVLGESNVMRLGTTGAGPNQQNSTFIAGITSNSISSVTSQNIMTIDGSDNVQCISAANFGSKVTVYSTPGTFTWTKDSRTRSVQVYGWNGGNGGGSGRKGVTGTNGGGGGGGAAASWFVETLSMFLGATETVVVGSGGAGGASQTVDNTNGLIGGLGGTSRFGNFFSDQLDLAGGQPGRNGSSGTNNGGNIFISQTQWSSNVVGESGQVGAGTPAQDVGGGQGGYQCPFSAGSGGGGAGNAPGLFGGGTGGSILGFDDSIILQGGGLGGSHDGRSQLLTGGIITGGSGGAGGTTNTIFTLRSGGNGGFPGGGGGGGACGTTGGLDSGKGGDGGGGQIIVIEIF